MHDLILRKGPTPSMELQPMPDPQVCSFALFSLAASRGWTVMRGTYALLWGRGPVVLIVGAQEVKILGLWG